MQENIKAHHDNHFDEEVNTLPRTKIWQLLAASFGLLQIFGAPLSQTHFPPDKCNPTVTQSQKEVVWHAIR